MKVTFREPSSPPSFDKYFNNTIRIIIMMMIMIMIIRGRRVK